MISSLYNSACNTVEGLMETVGLNLEFSAYQFLYPPKSDSFDPADIGNIIKENPKEFPSFKSLAPVFVWCALFSIVRFIFQRFVGEKLTYSAMSIDQESLKDFRHNRDWDLALPSKKKKPPTPEAIQEYFEKNKDKISGDLGALKDYIKSRYKKECNGRNVSKFTEAFWRCIFYTTFVVVACYTFFYPETQPFIKDLELCWKNWPLGIEHKVIPMLIMYHHVQLGCYMHQWMWTEVGRSDWIEMWIHHAVTITLITISYLINLQRIGAIIMLVHDTADIFLESAKLCNYISKAKHKYKDVAKVASDVLFAIFAVTFFVTRLIIFPFWVLHSVYFHGGQYAFDWLDSNYMGGKIVTFSLFTLQILHIFWFYTILKMVYKLLTTGIEGDERSDDEEGNAIADKVSVNSDNAPTVRTGIMDAHGLPGHKKHKEVEGKKKSQ